MSSGLCSSTAPVDCGSAPAAAGSDWWRTPGSGQLHVKAYNATNEPAVERLASNTIYSIVEDKAGRIYAGTAKGVDRLNPETGHVKHFTVADGLAHGELRSALRDASGNLWFATMQGLSRLSPTADRPPAIPSVRIVDLRVGRDRYPVSQVGETRILRGDLQPSQNQLQVEFVGFNDEPEDSLSYKYKLEGGDSDWQAPGRDHQANYPGLDARKLPLPGQGGELGRSNKHGSSGDRFHCFAHDPGTLVVSHAGVDAGGHHDLSPV